MNPFPEPDTIDKDLNKDVREYIKYIFEKKGKIEFYELVKFLEESVSMKDNKLSQIIGYYCYNIISNNNNLSLTKKQELIDGIYREVYKEPVVDSI